MLDFYTAVLGLKFVSDADAFAAMSTKFGTSPHGLPDHSFANSLRGKNQAGSAKENCSSTQPEPGMGF
jgi:catechol 2,3-dioxygenase-like lactoylglutathione lyase family enzyme